MVYSCNVFRTSVLNFLEWCQFALEHYMDEYTMLREGGKFKMDRL